MSLLTLLFFLSYEFVVYRFREVLGMLDFLFWATFSAVYVIEIAWDSLVTASFAFLAWVEFFDDSQAPLELERVRLRF